MSILLYYDPFKAPDYYQILPDDPVGENYENWPDSSTF